MSFETKFIQEITDFERYGLYTYKFDEVGNVIMNSSSADFSQVYLALPLSNFVYDNSKILDFYDPTFTEFVPKEVEKVPTQDDIDTLQIELDAEKNQNEKLSKKLDEVIAINEVTPSTADQEATKQVILELRMALGQGRVESDFSSEFPYSAIQKPTNLTSGSAEATQ